MRSMVQLDAFLVRYVIMNRLEKKKREREQKIKGVGWEMVVVMKL